MERLENRQLLSAAAVTAAAVSGRVTGFTLINPSTDRAVTTLRNGSVIDLATLPSGRLNVRADTSPGTVGSVKLFLDGALRSTEGTRPYALFGDRGNDFNGQTLSPGRHTIRAVPFSGVGGKGATGEARTITVTVVDNRPAPLPTVTGFSIIDPETGDVVSALTNGDEIALGDFADGNFSIRANTSPATVGSVRFGLDDDANVQTENTAPYSLFGNLAGTYVGGTLAPGEYTLRATPFTSRNGTGRAGATRAVTFTVVDDEPEEPGPQVFIDADRNGTIEASEAVPEGGDLDLGDIVQVDERVLVRIINPNPGPLVLDGELLFETEAPGSPVPNIRLSLLAPTGETGDISPNVPGDSGEEFNAEFRLRTVGQLSNPADPNSPIARVVTFLLPDGSGPLVLPGTDTAPGIDERSIELIVSGDVINRGRGSGSLTRSGRGRFRVRGNVVQNQ